MKGGPLTGIKVLDLTTVILGPYATQILGDLGADVIKVESPEGDQNREFTPGRSNGMSGASINLNRNKRSIALDLKRPAGHEAALRLAATADVFIHNIRPQAIARLGLTYEDVRAVRPDIVYCATIGFSRDGPYGDKPAYDDMIQGASGLAGLMARYFGTPGYVPSTVCDKIVALAAVYSVVSALFHRERTGFGQEIEVPMFETMAAFNLVEHIADAVFEPPLGGLGYSRVLAKHRRPYRTADGYVSILPYTNRQWQAFFEIADRKDLATDQRFVDFANRAANIDTLYSLVDQIASSRTTANWVELCDRKGIPAMPMNDIGDLTNDRHLRAVGFFTERDHHSEGPYLSIGSPVRFGSSPASVRRDAPRLGENGVEVLTEAGYSAAAIAKLIAEGSMVGACQPDKVAPSSDRESATGKAPLKLNTTPKS